MSISLAEIAEVRRDEGADAEADGRNTGSNTRAFDSAHSGADHARAFTLPHPPAHDRCANVRADAGADDADADAADGATDGIPVDGQPVVLLAGAR